MLIAALGIDHEFQGLTRSVSRNNLETRYLGKDRMDFTLIPNTYLGSFAGSLRLLFDRFIRSEKRRLLRDQLRQAPYDSKSKISRIHSVETASVSFGTHSNRKRAKNEMYKLR